MFVKKDYDNVRVPECSKAIYTNDGKAIDRLKEKLKKLKKEKENIKAREHETWEITNVNANIRETKLRIDRLESKNKGIFTL